MSGIRSRYCPTCRRPQQDSRLCAGCKATNRRARKARGSPGGNTPRLPDIEARIARLAARADLGLDLFPRGGE